MYNLGIFEVIPAAGQVPLAGNLPQSQAAPWWQVQFQPIQLPVILRSGWMEIINKTPYDLQFNLQPGGLIYQDSWSKCVYKLTDAGQAVEVFVQPGAGNYTPGNVYQPITNIVMSPPNALIAVNVYEEGEIEWYPPIALSPQYPSGQNTTGYTNYGILGVSPFNSAVTVGNPANSTVPYYLLGFDFTYGLASTATGGTLKIGNIMTNFDQLTNNALFYQIGGNSQYANPLIVRFPTPIYILNGGAVFTPPALSGVTNSINIYYTQQ